MCTHGTRRTLSFGEGEVQSEMSLTDPVALVLAYARAMMCFVLFKPAPREILMVGLGGGSLLKFCHRHLPGARITVLELRADVIALREHFLIPPDDERLRVIETDACAFLAQTTERFDVLLIDGFDAYGLPPALCSLRFYRDCQQALRPDGVMVSNIFHYDPQHTRMLARMRAVFGADICWFDGACGNNHIVFCIKGGVPGVHAASHARRMCRRVARHQGTGLRWLNALLARAVVAWLGRSFRRDATPYPTPRSCG